MCSDAAVKIVTSLLEMKITEKKRFGSSRKSGVNFEHCEPNIPIRYPNGDVHAVEYGIWSLVLQ